MSNTEPGTSVRRRRRTWAVLCVALLLIAAACGSGDDESEGGNANGEVDILIWASREFYVPADEFEGVTKEHPEINITYDVLPNDDIIQQLQRRMEAGQELPDIIHDDTPNLPTYVGFDAIQPLTDVLDDWQSDDQASYDLMLPTVWADGTFDGEVYGMASAANADFLYYNTRWFEEAGIDPDSVQSWDDVLEVAHALKETRPDSDPFGAPFVSGQGVSDRMAAMNAAGVEFVDGIPQLTGDAGLYMIDWYKQMADEDLLTAEAVAWSGDELRGSFIAGDTGLMIDGLTTAADFEEVPDFTFQDDWDTINLPVSRTGDTTDGVRTAASRTWMITTGAEDPTAAGYVLRHIAASEQLVTMVEAGAAGPRNTEALQSDFVAEFWPFFGEKEQEAFSGAASPPIAENPADVEATLEMLFQEIAQGVDSSAEELAEKYQAELDALA